MRQKHTLDPKKALQAVLYVAKRVPDIYTALKVLYFADTEHLAKYGRLIFGDSYVAMQHGPVPSTAYDIVKCARGERLPLTGLSIAKTFSVIGNNLVPRREPNLDLLSESDIECLDNAIEKFGRLSFSQLNKLSTTPLSNQRIRMTSFPPKPSPPRCPMVICSLTTCRTGGSHEQTGRPLPRIQIAATRQSPMGGGTSALPLLRFHSSTQREIPRSRLSRCDTSAFRDQLTGPSVHCQ